MKRAEDTTIHALQLLLLHYPGEDANTLKEHPWLRRLIGNDVAHDELREDLANERGQAWILEVLRRKQNGKRGFYEELTI